jgi:hypothetical protein
MIDHFQDFSRWNPVLNLDRVPVFLVHMVTGPNLLVTITQFQSEIGFTFQIYSGRKFVE